MAAQFCPLCGQALPQSLTPTQIASRIEELSSPLLRRERQSLEDAFKDRLTAEREAARREAEAHLKRELAQAKKRADKAEKERQDTLTRQEQRIRDEQQRARREAEITVRRELTAARKQVAELELDAATKIERAQRQTEQRLNREMARSVRAATLENERKL